MQRKKTITKYNCT